MSAAPYYLLAAGILLVIIGFLLAGTGRRSGPTLFHPSMRDEDIARNLRREQRGGIANLFILVGFLCVFVSVVWRIVRFFV